MNKNFDIEVVGMGFNITGYPGAFTPTVVEVIIMKTATEEYWHYKRTCEYCGYVWAGLHCIHDGYQNPCPNCGKRPIPVSEPVDDICDCEFDC